MGPRKQSCDTFAKNIAAFCHCVKNQPEAKLKSYVLNFGQDSDSSLVLIVSCSSLSMPAPTNTAPRTGCKSAGLKNIHVWIIRVKKECQFCSFMNQIYTPI